jgi:purine-binding chemotaxis protein CheW
MAAAQETRLAVRGGAGGDEAQLVLFDLDGGVYGVPVLAVEEIIRYQAITTVPHAPAFVQGVTNLRGRIIPVIDLRERFGLPRQEATTATRIVVVETSGMTVGLTVDSVDEVCTITDDNIQPPSPIVTTVASEFLMGVGRLPTHGGGQQLVVLLDLDRITTVEQREAIAAVSELSA